MSPLIDPPASTPTPVIPPLYAPIPAAIHPRHAAIDARTAAWARRFGAGSRLSERLAGQDIGVFASRILPAGREEVVQLAGDFVLWLFLVDDGVIEEGDLGKAPGALTAALQRLLWVAENPEAELLGGDPLAEGLRDLRARVARYGTAGQTALWVNALREYALSVAWEAGHRAAGSVPDLADYTLMRLYDGATTVILPLLEMAYGYELSPEERTHPAVRAAAEMASFIITWDNDLFSAHKEFQEAGQTGDYYLNALRVLTERHGLSPAQAVGTAIAQRDRVMVHFERVRAALAAEAAPQLRQYLDSLGHFVRASLDWGISSRRYTTPHDPAGLPTHFAAAPTDDRDEPLDIGAISWWWDPDRLRLDPAARRPFPAAALAGLTTASA
ncbi:selina-4(15),7(11)-diene synthase [Streptomyces sp. Ru73]|uniref:selina-4(15),7(11)-diene synthase n=1 Tax=Streptomyces sp. Ru73 TaxID=2080748 RepID=UPI001CA53EED|nr:selina-4(15),7(11)-diene synthase [Streptomyces sp. Ru73]